MLMWWASPCLNYLTTDKYIDSDVERLEEEDVADDEDDDVHIEEVKEEIVEEEPDVEEEEEDVEVLHDTNLSKPAQTVAKHEEPQITEPRLSPYSPQTPGSEQLLVDVSGSVPAKQTPVSIELATADRQTIQEMQTSLQDMLTILQAQQKEIEQLRSSLSQQRQTGETIEALQNQLDQLEGALSSKVTGALTQHHHVQCILFEVELFNLDKYFVILPSYS